MLKCERGTFYEPKWIAMSQKGHIEIFYDTEWIEIATKRRIEEIYRHLHYPKKSRKSQNGKSRAPALPEKELKEP